MPGLAKKKKKKRLKRLKWIEENSPEIAEVLATALVKAMHLVPRKWSPLSSSKGAGQRWWDACRESGQIQSCGSEKQVASEAVPGAEKDDSV